MAKHLAQPTNSPKVYSRKKTQVRLGVGGGYTASPIAADGRVYLPSQSGTIVVVDGRAKELKILARNLIGENITATPALAENLMYVRTDRHLFAFAHK